MSTRTRPRTKTPPPPLDHFSATELRAAEQLVQLSESSAEAAAAATEESCSDTPKSVNTGPPLLSIAEYEEDEIGFGGRRKNHRYRSIGDLYEATSPMSIGFSKEGRRKKKGDKR